jgi:hypothetical protein
MTRCIISIIQPASVYKGVDLERLCLSFKWLCDFVVVASKALEFNFRVPPEAVGCCMVEDWS